MRTIHKHQLPLEHGNHWIRVRGRARALSVGVQHGLPMLWVSVDDADPVADMEIFVAYTGGVLPCFPDECFVGTVILEREGLVLHVFDARPARERP